MNVMYILIFILFVCLLLIFKKSEGQTPDSCIVQADEKLVLPNGSLLTEPLLELQSMFNDSIVLKLSTTQSIFKNIIDFKPELSDDILMIDSLKGKSSIVQSRQDDILIKSDSAKPNSSIHAGTLVESLIAQLPASKDKDLLSSLNTFTKPTGTISNTLQFNRDLYPLYPWANSLTAFSSQTIATVPFALGFTLNSFGWSRELSVLSYNVSFDRDAFLESIRQKLIADQQQKYKMIFDSLSNIKSKFGKFDSILLDLANDELAKKADLAKAYLDSLKTSANSLVVEDERYKEAQALVARYKEIRKSYTELLNYKKQILAQFGTLDFNAITSKFQLPVKPEELQEDALLKQAQNLATSKLNKFLGGLKSLSLGETIFHESPLTIYQKVASGLSFQFELNQLYFGGTVARERLNDPQNLSSFSKPFQSLSLNKYNIISQGIVGLGKPDKNFLQVSATHFRFAEQASSTVSAATIPYRNSLVSISSGVGEYKGFIAVIEFVASKNSYGQAILPETEDASNFSQHLGKRILLSKKFKASSTFISTEITETGPLYKTYGNTYQTADSRSMKGEYRQGYLNNKLQSSARISYNQFNRSGLFQQPFYNLNYAIELKYAISKGSISLKYNPVINSFQSNTSSVTQRVVEGQLIKNYALKKAMATTMVTLSTFKMQNRLGVVVSDTLSNMSISSYRVDLVEQLFISPSLTFSLLTMLQCPEDRIGQIDFALFELSSELSVFKSMKLSLAANSNFIGTAYFLGARAGTSFPLFSKGALCLNYDARVNVEGELNLQSVIYQGMISYTHNF